MKRIYRILVISLIVSLGLASCVTPSQVNYLQDMRHGTQIELEHSFQAKISPYDELDIYVLGANQELAAPFNLGGNNIQRGPSSTAGSRGAYLVDVNGNIQFPVLGTIHVAGLTRLQLQDTIASILLKGDLLPDPVVMVRCTNFKIFFLGAEGGRVLNVTNERCTFLEALAMVGDLNIYTNRNKVAVMREVDGKMVMRYLDPRSSAVFQDPFFMLQQNDFIITQKYTKETPQNEMRNLISWLSMGVSIITLVTTIMQFQFFKGNN